MTRVMRAETVSEKVRVSMETMGGGGRTYGLEGVGGIAPGWPTSTEGPSRGGSHGEWYPSL